MKIKGRFLTWGNTLGKLGYYTVSEFTIEFGLGLGFNIRVGFDYYHKGRMPYSAVPLNKGPVGTFIVFTKIFFSLALESN